MREVIPKPFSIREEADKQRLGQEVATALLTAKKTGKPVAFPADYKNASPGQRTAIMNAAIPTLIQNGAEDLINGNSVASLAENIGYKVVTTSGAILPGNVGLNTNAGVPISIEDGSIWKFGITALFTGTFPNVTFYRYGPTDWIQMAEAAKVPVKIVPIEKPGNRAALLQWETGAINAYKSKGYKNNNEGRPLGNKETG